VIAIQHAAVSVSWSEAVIVESLPPGLVRYEETAPASGTPSNASDTMR
jgi:hypothetical protein